MLSEKDKEKYIEVLLALGGHLNKDADEEEDRGVVDDSGGFHSSRTRPMQRVM